MLARSTTIDPRLQMINMQPLIQAAQVREKARADLNKSVVDAIDEFNKKKKKQMEDKISIKNIQEILGVDNPALAKDILKNPMVLEAYKFQQESDAEANRVQKQYDLEMAKIQNKPKSAKELQIERLQEVGMTRNQAIGVVDGALKVVTDPTSGRSSVVDMRTNEITPTALSEDFMKSMTSKKLNPGGGAPIASTNLYQIAEGTTGIVPTLTAALQGVTGQLGFDVASDELIQKKQTFNSAASQMRKALRTSSKVLATEMEMLDKEFDIEPSAFKDVKTLRNKIISIDRTVGERIGFLEEVISDQYSNVDDVNEARRLRTDLLNFKRILGVNPQIDSAASRDIQSLVDKYGNL